MADVRRGSDAGAWRLPKPRTTFRGPFVMPNLDGTAVCPSRQPVAALPTAAGALAEAEEHLITSMLSLLTDGLASGNSQVSTGEDSCRMAVRDHDETNRLPDNMERG
jgi:hypothetical protein